VNIKVSVRFFASFKELINRDRDVFQFKEEATLKDLRSQIVAKYPSLKNVTSTMLISVNECFVKREEMKLKDGDVIAFFPSVSGG